jgi:hypothetical protein
VKLHEIAGAVMKYENKLTVVVVLGKMNPAILSHDFLKQNKILPTELCDQTPKPMITPVLSLVEYDKKLTIVVEQERFVVQSLAEEGPSFIPGLVTAYFKTLPFTPLSSVGVNFQGKALFADATELGRLKSHLTPGGHEAAAITRQKTTEWGVRFKFPKDIFTVSLSFDWIKADQTDIPDIPVSINYHRDLAEGEQRHTQLKEAVDQMSNLLDDFKGFLAQLVT